LTGSNTFVAQYEGGSADIPCDFFNSSIIVIPY
jgi:hypothetical protein